MAIASLVWFMAIWAINDWWAAAEASGGVQWKHPAGLVDGETIAEVRSKLANEQWARDVYSQRKVALDRWIKASAVEVKRVFPKTCGNVYHNFSCPKDRHRLTFDPFECRQFRCPICGAVYLPETDAGIYAEAERRFDLDPRSTVFIDDRAEVYGPLLLEYGRARQTDPAPTLAVSRKARTAPNSGGSGGDPPSGCPESGRGDSPVRVQGGSWGGVCRHPAGVRLVPAGSVS